VVQEISSNRKWCWRCPQTGSGAGDVLKQEVVLEMSSNRKWCRRCPQIGSGVGDVLK